MSGKFFRIVLAVVLLAVMLVTAVPSQATASAQAPVLAMEHGTTGT